MKRNHLLCSVLLLCVLVFCAGLAFAAPETLDDAGKTVVSIEVKELPAKTEYFVKEKFDISGGVILVTYDDGSTAEKLVDTLGQRQPEIQGEENQLQDFRCGEGPDGHLPSEL